jgi:N-methylhydantoinase B
VFLLGERGKVAPFGVSGGSPAALNRFVWEADDGEHSPPLVSKVTGVALPSGRAVRLESPGGGGWGDPKTRDPDLVRRDVRLGYVSAEAAKREYGVVITNDGEVDQAATAALRNGIAA